MIEDRELATKLDSIEVSLIRDMENRDKAEAIALREKIVQTKLSRASKVAEVMAVAWFNNN